ncbi:hypothetical protein B0J11DRAFT_434800 [Dendryphion nanum]|uniref:Sld7 C-terminal domain-containing protein n=1 Tax=Dendryphion nanum TaxID=256645 RepID=A0A9P9DV43_9PLEO|nr:hypothetical protein B0J11DRAFT_434800 [Dendryphion nanum]
MADIWSGDILLSDDTIITDVVLASPNTGTPYPYIASSNLRFLSTVDTARIPLYLAAGPSLNVWTTSEKTERWFQTLLLNAAASEQDASLDSRAWWECARSQSPIGVLVRVQNDHVEDTHTASRTRVTELLFYGTVASPSSITLPTPPSSSPDPHEPTNTDNDHVVELRVHALPLSSDLLSQATLQNLSSASPALSTSEPAFEPQFLPTLYSPNVTPSSPKRGRDIFEEATELRRKARRKGGEGVAAAAAKASDSQGHLRHRNSLSVDTTNSPFPDLRPLSANGLSSRPPSRQLSRSPSVTSDNRPVSRKGLIDSQPKRSTLSHVETVPAQPDEPTTESRNKEALSRIVMAAMRMQGLQQRKKNKSRHGSVVPDEQLGSATKDDTVIDAAKDEEFKLIYHQTYKSAALALRKHMLSKPLYLQPDQLRDVVERLLAIFCTDPLTPPLVLEEPSNVLATPGNQNKLSIPRTVQHHASPFDLPSGKRTVPSNVSHIGHPHTGSPISRRKERLKT